MCPEGICKDNVLQCGVDQICQNEGLCIGKHHLLCVCTWGYEGPDCSIDIDECQYNDICKDGLTCESERINTVHCSNTNDLDEGPTNMPVQTTDDKLVPTMTKKNMNEKTSESMHKGTTSTIDGNTFNEITTAKNTVKLNQVKHRNGERYSSMTTYTMKYSERFKLTI